MRNRYAVLVLALGLSACSSAPRKTEMAHLHLEKLAWVGYSVSVDCESDCKYTKAEQKKLAQRIADRSFASLNESLNTQSVKETVANPVFKNAEIRNDSLKSKVGRWFEKLKLSHSPDTTATVEGLKDLNPDELGWSGEESLKKLAGDLGVNGTLVGRVEVKIDPSGKILSQEPKIWVFTASQ